MDLQLGIADFLGFCDMNGIEAMQTEQVQQLEDYIRGCKKSMDAGTHIVSDVIYTRLMDILCKVNPESELCKYIWEGSVDEPDVTDNLLVNHPMYSIQTVRSFDCDELHQYVERLPDCETFDAHVSVKLVGCDIRLKYSNGKFVQARSRSRTSAGRDITRQLSRVLYDAGVDIIDDLSGFGLCEVRGVWVLPVCNMVRAVQCNPGITSALEGVFLLGSDESSEDEWGLLQFVAYEFIANGMTFETKQEEYDFLEGLGFTVPLSWEIPDMTKETFIDDLQTIVADCESEVKPDTDNPGYDYFTDGLVFTLDDYNMFRSLGVVEDRYSLGNLALQVGYWKQDVFQGFVQTILWVNGKVNITPVAIVGESPDMVGFVDEGEHPYIFDSGMITPDSWDLLGVTVAGGAKVKSVPLYSPAGILILDAYPGSLLSFRHGDALGVVPCFEDGTPLLEGRIRQMLEG